MKKLLLFIIVVVSNLINARTPDTIWSKTLDFEGNNIPYNVISTSDNNFLTAGISFDYIDNGDAIFLIKFDGDGNILWSNHYNFIYQDEWWFPNVIEINGIYYVCSRNIIFAIDNNGELIWEKEYENVWYFKGINKTENDDIILTGTEYTYFDGGNKFIIFKISTNGDVEWSYYSINWQSTAAGEDIIENSEGDYVITGENGGACQNQIYMKFDENGDFLGNQQYGCWGYGNSITEKNNNGGYLIGGNELRSINSSYGSEIWEKPYETFFAKQISDKNILIAGFNYLAKLDLEGNEIETFLISEIDSNYVLVDIHYSNDYIIAVGTIEDSILLMKLNINLNIINIPQDFETIQEGINASIDGDTILVSPGTYYENINFNGKNISVIGENRESTIIDGGQNGSVVTFENSETNLAILDGFTIKNGDGYSGGGVSIHSSSPKISNNIITGNLGQWGGGIYCENSTANFSRNIISFNNANYNGGGIFRDDDGSINIINCVLYGNNASSNGGGISTYSPDYIINTVIFNNSAPNSNNIHGSPNPIITFSNIQYGYSPIGEGNIESDPLFFDPENGIFSLQSNSLCIDAGDPNSPLDPDGTIADMGAYYFSQFTGCMDENAINYNSEVHIEDNSCNYGINLSYGNNLVSFAGYPNIDSTALLLESIESQGANVNFIIGQGVGLFKTDDGWSGNLNTVDEKSAYWLNVEGNLEWLLQYENGYSDICTDYDLEYGNNLISYLGVDNSNTIESLGGQTISNLYGFIIGQGVGLFNTAGQWSGNLNNLNKNQGYWLNSYSTTPFRWGIGTDCDMPNASLAKEEVVNIIPKEYQFVQSTEQAFYLIDEILVDHKSAIEGDVLLAYYNDILVGSALVNPNMTVLPVMGRDLSEQTIGFLEIGKSPILKLVKSNGEIIELESNLDGFENLLVSEISLIKGNTVELPTEWSLAPAYPNPFNPVTTIKFGVPLVESLRVMTLHIYNINGRLIETLIDGQIEAGFHTVEWDATGFPSGVYFVKMNIDNPSINSGQGFIQTQKLILLK